MEDLSIKLLRNPKKPRSGIDFSAPDRDAILTLWRFSSSRKVNARDIIRSDDNSRSVALASEVGSSHASCSRVRSSDRRKILNDNHGTIRKIYAAGRAPPPAEAWPQENRRSVTPVSLISFEDGEPYKTLRRPLSPRGLPPEAYRAKWGLTPDAPR